MQLNCWIWVWIETRPVSRYVSMFFSIHFTIIRQRTVPQPTRSGLRLISILPRAAAAAAAAAAADATAAAPE
jgi:hypothetical protein